MSLRSALHLSRRTAPAFAVMGSLWGAFAAMVPQIKLALGAGDAAFGAALFASALGLVTAMWLAPLADRRLGVRAMPMAAAMLACAFLLPGIAPGLVVFGLAMGLCGLSSGLLDVVMNARVSEAEARADAPLMNLNHAMFSLAYMFGAIWAGIGREAGLPALAIFAPLTLIGLLATRAMHQPVADTSGDDAGASGGFPLRVVVWGGLIVTVGFMAENASEGWSALHLERTLGGRAAEGALGPTLLGLTMFVGRLSGQVVADRWRARTVLVWASLVSAAGSATAAWAGSIAVAYVGFAALGLGVSVLAPMALAMVGRAVPPRHRTNSIAKVAVIGFLGFFIAPPLMGLVAQGYGLRIAFSAIAVMLLAVPVFVAMLVRVSAAPSVESRA
ncbi:MFS transporter [Oceaniovalibus guishaninsula]|nr:MFS transporter [Oceaniovalibus guishaninsula]